MPDNLTDQTSISQMMNLGPSSEKMLSTVGITNETDLRRIGSIEAFIKVREAGLNPSLNLLYALDGAISGIKWNNLPIERREFLDMTVNFERDINKTKRKRTRRLC